MIDRVRRLLALALVGTSVLAACTGAEDATFRPSIDWVTCPDDIEIQMLTRHRCGFLTVLQDRTEPEGLRLRLFVTEVYPAGATPPASHVGSGFHSDLGRVTGQGDTGAGATRVESVVYTMSLRGLAPSEPSLACPEADQLDDRAIGTTADDEELRGAFVDAVSACRERLVGDGIDPADFGVEAVAADMDDLRTALGIERWYFLNSYGTSARYLFEYLRKFPDRVRAAWLDSPQFPHMDEITTGVRGTRVALTELFESCAADPACANAYPDLDRTWGRALERLAEQPQRVRVTEPLGDELEVLVDDAALLRGVRAALGGDGPSELEAVPATIADAARGRISDRLASTLVRGPVFCAGYQPLCTDSEPFSLGNYLTVLCRDELPFLDRSAIEAEVAGEPAFERVFLSSPFVAACDAWDVPPADGTTAEPVSTDVPLLILPGQFDSYSPPSVAASTTDTLGTSWVVAVPGQTHNTLGFHDCPIEIRNAWNLDPVSAPEDGCLASMPAVDFAA